MTGASVDMIVVVAAVVVVVVAVEADEFVEAEPLEPDTDEMVAAQTRAIDAAPEVQIANFLPQECSSAPLRSADFHIRSLDCFRNPS